jgi:hypothetical protein
MPIPNYIYKCTDINSESAFQQRYHDIEFTLLKRIQCGDNFFCVIQHDKNPSKILCVPQRFIARWNNLSFEDYESCEQITDD